MELEIEEKGEKRLYKWLESIVFKLFRFLVFNLKFSFLESFLVEDFVLG